MLVEVGLDDFLKGVGDLEVGLRYDGVDGFDYVFQGAWRRVSMSTVKVGEVVGELTLRTWRRPGCPSTRLREVIRV